MLYCISCHGGLCMNVKRMVHIALFGGPVPWMPLNEDT